MGWASGITVGGVACEMVSCNVKETIEIVDDDGLRGTRTRQQERMAQGLKHVAGQIVLQPSPTELNACLPFFVGNGSTLTVSDTMADCTIVMSNATATYTFLTRMNKGSISGESGKKMTLTLDILGKTLTISAGGSPGTPDVTARPYMFYDMGSGITIGGTTYLIDRFEWGVDNAIVPTFMAGQVATDLEPTDRHVTLAVQTKYTSTEAGLLTANRAAQAVGTGIAASIAFAGPSNTLSLSFPALMATSESVTIPGRQHVRLPLAYRCLGLGTAKECTVTST